jgi:hypothetical protein
MKRRRVVSAVFLFFLVPALVVFAGGKREREQEEIKPGKGFVAYFDGDVTVNGIPAVTGENVFDGDRISTGTDSFCEIIFPEKNVFRIQQQSDLVFGSREFVLDRGSIAVVTDKLKRLAFNNDSLSVRTSSAVAGIRGTVFFIKKEDENNTYVCICRGKINTYAWDGKGKSTDESTHHKGIRLTRTEGRVKRSDAGLLYHDDELMEEVASRIGLEINWRY